MKAVVIDEPGGIDALKIKNIPIPPVKPGWVLVRIRAFGIGRGEVLTRRGESPAVKFPRVIGVECVGEIEDPSDSNFSKGDRVVSMMGGLGRDFDGSYEEYALIPAQNVYPVESNLDWPVLAAIPETYYTAYSSVAKALCVKEGDNLLVRGGTSTVSIAALHVAKAFGATVLSTSRDVAKEPLLKELGADHVLREQADIGGALFGIYPNGVNKVLEMIGTKTLNNSLSLLAPGGIACMTGELGGEWEFGKWAPMDYIKSETYLTIFASTDIDEARVQELFRFIEEHALPVNPAHVFPLEQIREAHALVESGKADGKVVIQLP